jgi:hypothetical protein
VDIGGRRADTEYDALGRLVRAWAPGQSKADKKDPTSTFGYRYRTDAPTVVTTGSLRENGGYATSYTLYDGMLRERQTQLPAVASGRIVNDWFYHSRGLKAKVNGSYYNDQAAVIFRKLGIEQWRTSFGYADDRVTTVPPPGGTTTTVIRDVHGNAVEKRQYHGREAAYRDRGRHSRRRRQTDRQLRVQHVVRREHRAGDVADSAGRGRTGLGADQLLLQRPRAAHRNSGRRHGSGRHHADLRLRRPGRCPAAHAPDRHPDRADAHG